MTQMMTMVRWRLLLLAGCSCCLAVLADERWAAERKLRGDTVSLL
jgi:hypothetical protein